jgi:hypothetical protein
MDGPKKTVKQGAIKRSINIQNNIVLEAIPISVTTNAVGDIAISDFCFFIACFFICSISSLLLAMAIPY